MCAQVGDSLSPGSCPAPLPTMIYSPPAAHCQWSVCVFPAHCCNFIWCSSCSFPAEEDARLIIDCPNDTFDTILFRGKGRVVVLGPLWCHRGHKGTWPHPSCQVLATINTQYTHNVTLRYPCVVLHVCLVVLESLMVTVSGFCPLQGCGAGEPTHRQPNGPEQPLHPGRSWEQLLSLTCTSVWQRRPQCLGFGREPRLLLMTGSTAREKKKKKANKWVTRQVALTPASHFAPCVIGSQRNWSNLKLSLKRFYFWLLCTVDWVTTELLMVLPQKCH